MSLPKLPLRLEPKTSVRPSNDRLGVCSLEGVLSFVTCTGSDPERAHCTAGDGDSRRRKVHTRGGTISRQSGAGSRALDRLVAGETKEQLFASAAAAAADVAE